MIWYDWIVVDDGICWCLCLKLGFEGRGWGMNIGDVLCEFGVSVKMIWYYE